MPKRILIYGQKMPYRAIHWTVAVLTFLAGCFMLTPAYGPGEFSPFFGSALTPEQILIGAVLTIIVNIPSLYGLIRGNEWIRHGAICLFMWYLFLALSRIFLIEFPLRLIWLPMLLVALIMGIIFLAEAELFHERNPD